MGLFDNFMGLFQREPIAPPTTLVGGSPSTALVRVDAALPVVHMRQDSTINPWTGFGDPTRDKGSVARPNILERPLTTDELLALWRNGGLARRLVELLPDRAIRKGWSAPEIDTAEEERLSLYDRWAEAWKMGDLLGGSLLLMVTEDDLPPGFRQPGQEWRWLAEPLNLQRIGKLHALQVFDAREATPHRYDGDIRSPNYRQPLLWQITDRGIGGTGRSLIVHHSRVIWFRGAKVPPSEIGRARWGNGNMPDMSVLQALWNEIRRLTETQQGGAILAMEIRQKVLKVGNLERKLTGDQTDQFKVRMNFMQKMLSVLGVLVIGEGDEYDSRSNATTGYKDLSDAAYDAVAAAKGWPKVVVRGDAPSGLNTDGASAWQSFHQTVSDEQERKRSPLNRVYRVIYAAQDGPTRGKEPKNWAIVFHPLDEPNQKDMAEVRLKMAQVDQIYVPLGAYTARDVVERRMGPDGFVMDLQGLPLPDPDALAEKAIEQAERMRLALEGGGDPRRAGGDPEDDEPETRGDAAGGDGTVIVVPAAEPSPELVAKVEQAIGQRLRRPTNPSHVTVLFLGEGLEGIDVDETVGVVEAEALDTMAHTLRQPVLRAFPPGPDGTPVIVEFEDAWTLSSLNERLLRRLAHIIRARQFRRYRAHLTLGYAAEPLTASALTALAELQVEDLAVSVVVLEVRSADEVVQTVQVGG